MPRYITLGTFTNEGAAGLVDGDSDRRVAMEALCNSVGATLVDHYITYVSSRRWACGCDPTIAVKVASLGYPLEHQAIWLYPKVAPSSVMGLAEGADSYLLPKGFHGAAQ